MVNINFILYIFIVSFTYFSIRSNDIISSIDSIEDLTYNTSRSYCNNCFSKNFVSGAFILNNGQYKTYGSSFILIPNQFTNLNLSNVTVVLTKPFKSVIIPVVYSTVDIIGNNPTIYGNPTSSSFTISNIQENQLYFFIACPTT